ncbi:MAG: iron chelate uptake ABC transporter family permease subunit [Paracoccaceae bacterium]|nr:iron chelate uptake ABC transporter family permease subunit [Paracoccaceae bacterium]
MTITTMIDDFLLRAGLAVVALALATGPLGCFVLWRRMAYFGDATAHAAILGVAISFGFNLSIELGVLAVALAMALSVSALSNRGHSMDGALGALSHSALALGLVGISFIQGVRIDVEAYLFGDILAISQSDLWTIWAGALIVVALIFWRWQKLLTSTLNQEIARASGINPAREQLILTIALAIVVAVAIKILGALLISAMLLIPTATARVFSNTPERMVLLSVLLSMAAGIGGLWLSFTADTPAGPSIVVAAAALFLLSTLFGRNAR